MKGSKRLNQNLIKAVKNQNVEEVRRALAQGADANSKDSHNAPILVLALISCENKKVVELLLQKGANPNTYIEEAGATVLFQMLTMSAAEKDSELDLLLSQVPKSSSSFLSPEEKVEILLKYGADPYQKMAGGITAFDLAKYLGPSIEAHFMSCIQEVEADALVSALPSLPEAACQPHKRVRL